MNLSKFNKKALVAAMLAMFTTAGAWAVEGVDAEPASMPGRLLVKFKSELAAADAEAGAVQLGAREVRRLRAGGKAQTRVANRWRLMLFAEDANIGQIMERVSRLPGVAWVEPDYIVYAAEIPNDSRFNELWGMHNTGQTGGTADADIDAPEAWDILAGGNTLVAVVDTGIDYNHPDLAANVWSNPGEIAGNFVDDDGNGYVDDTRGWDFVSNDNNPFDDNSHGTHVSGTIAAVGNNSQGVVGVNRSASIMPLKFLNASGSGSTADAVEAIYYAIDNGAKVMNHSWGGGGFSQSLSDAFTASQNANIVMAVAAGNSSRNIDTSPTYPASLPQPNIIAVAATTHNDALASFSNYGAAGVDLGAPGEAILSSVPNNGYSSFNGTSMATPHVAGAASLLLAAQPGLGFQQVKDLLMTTADPVPALAGRTVSGGRLNLHDALAAVGNPPPVNQLPVAAAGGDRIMARRTAAVLDGTASFDPDGSIAGYAWTSSHRGAILLNATTATPTVAISRFMTVGTVVTITLTVTDNEGATDTDELTVTIQ